MTDWFRKQTWTKTDEEEFFAKLKRARKDGRAQYLRIQAITLIRTNDPDLLNVAETLLLKLLSEYPDDRLERSSTLQHLGEIYKHRGHLEKALAIAFEKTYPNVRTDAYLDYSEIIVKQKIAEKYAYAKELLLIEEPNLMFPISKYKVYSLLAIIYKNAGENSKADYYSKLAEENASAQTSGLRYHKYLGIVNERDQELDDLLNENGA